MVKSRVLGRTGLKVSELGFGCGDVGGLIVRGAPADRERAVARALELGINYFDTAASYGSGESEKNLGATLRALGLTSRLGTDVHVGTKFSVGAVGDVASAVARSLDASLSRLGLDRVDLLQLHDRIVERPAGERELTPEAVLGDVVPALEKLRDAGKIGFYGITALGDTGALHRTLGRGVLDTAQVCLNLLNPSAAVEVPGEFPAQDFERLLRVAERQRVGAIVIRVLAAGALSGTTARHTLAMPSVAPIASGNDYATDVRRAQALRALVNEGHADTLVEASLRFALTDPAVSTVLLGYSSLDHLEYAAAAIAKGPLSGPALTRLHEIWRGLAQA
jgi:aryl-alcohol dehydrogenase-like predicted oxidoreductase